MSIDWIAFGLDLIVRLQQTRPGLDAVAHGLSFFGSQAFFLTALPTLYWWGRRDLALRMLVLLLAVDALGSSLKIFWHGPRPYWLVPELALAGEQSYGVPSGHAASSLVVFGVLTMALRGAGWRLAIAVLLLGVGWSRLHLGVHFPHDVLVGWALGGLGIGLFAARGEAVASWAAQLDVRATLAWATLAAALLAGCGLLASYAVAGQADPAAWSIDTFQARAPTSAVAAGGALWGLWFAWRVAPLAPSELRGRLVLIALGMTGTAALYLGLGAAFATLAEPASAAGLVLRALRYAAITAWVVAGAPLMARRLAN